MQEITVNKEELLAKLRENRAKHRTVFEAALAGWRDEALARLEEKVAALKAGRFPEIKLLVTMPQDHTKDYDRIIMMVEMHTSSTFRLSEYDFQSYVMDDWDWKRQFIKTSSTYAAASVVENYGQDAIDD